MTPTPSSTGSSRPVWLFSLDSDQFWAAPTTTGGLKAYYQTYGRNPEGTDIELVHFRDAAHIRQWREHDWQPLLERARQALAQGQIPVAGFSMYTWNAADFLELISALKTACPELCVIAGGPHVQQAEDYLGCDPIDVIVLGEGEITFTEWLDAGRDADWSMIDGLAWLEGSNLRRSAPRKRNTALDDLPSALDVVPLTDAAGKPLYDAVSYETSRGCPFRCAFCEWGTGAIGTKMIQFSMDRIERDWRHIVASGIKDMWLADSNFGALKDDLAKAELICALKRDTGLPSTFATSWSKKHSPRVQQIVRLLHANGLLPHYQLALQTLTPEALRLSNRENMSANDYEPIARQMASEGVPIAAELIWGLPGDNLADFESGVTRLLATFPAINIFGYTLLPGTEFYEKREEYRIETVPVAGYGKALGEYVVACHSFDREQGLEGYFLIAAHIILNRGQLAPLTIRWLALGGVAPACEVLRELLRALLQTLSPAGLDAHSDRLRVYEQRAPLYLELLARRQETVDVMMAALEHSLASRDVPAEQRAQARQVLALDLALCPRTGERQQRQWQAGFDAARVLRALESLELPDAAAHQAQEISFALNHPGGADSVLHDPDGGAWLRGRLAAASATEDTLLASAG